jgi:uncharacterized glyoxalase superfamily protein PhnB
MKPHITVITLGVLDLERALAFYRDGMALKTDGIIGTEFEHGSVVFFDLQSGLKLALWENKSIAHDTGLPVHQGVISTNLTIGHNVSSVEEVDLMMNQASQAGARIIKPASQTFYGGYAGYFSDLDGHLWEVVYNPQWHTEEPI